jgi:CheY-like chemotaxis protein
MRILAADDDPIQLEAMRAWLSRTPAEVVTIENGSDAWDLLSRESFDLAIIDIHMPKLDGFGLIHWLRQTPRTIDLPIIVVTSRNDGEAIEQAYAAGATNFVTKPVNWQLFAHQVRFVLRSGQNEREMRTAQMANQIHERERNGVLSMIGDALEKAGTDPAAIQSLTRDLRWFNRALAGDLQTSQIALDLMMKETAERAQPEARKIGLKVIVRESLEDMTMNCDPDLMCEALARLCSHLMLQSAAGGQIELSAHIEESGRLMITARGGSAQSLRPALAPTLAQRIAVAHGGDLMLHAVPGEGAAAVLSLPAASVQSRPRSSAESLKIRQAS